MDLAPRHRLSFLLPGTWQTSVLGMLKHGAPWLHSGDTGENLLGLPESVLSSVWDGQGWATRLDGAALPLPPWAALESVIKGQPFPWVGAASFELTCDEAGLPRKQCEIGNLGQYWTSLREALHIKDGEAELWSWSAEPPDVHRWETRLAPSQASGHPPLELKSVWDEGQHREAVVSIQDRILEGGFYVANLCVPFVGKLAGDPLSLAYSSFERARPPYGAWLDMGGLRLLSLSMERLLSRRGERLWAQPIKGSTPLLGDPELDRSAAEAMVADPKERAEHTMILDLVRNDLGRVASIGSVQVLRSMEVALFPTVQHLVSTIEARARPGLGLAELLRAVLPGGSVTGAPKHAVCGHLAHTEAGPRGFYCGAIGWISPTGDLDLALPIRTAQIEGNDITYWSGGGITRRSDPAREWEELHLKTRAITG